MQINFNWQLQLYNNNLANLHSGVKIKGILCENQRQGDGKKVCFTGPAYPDFCFWLTFFFWK